MFKAKKASKRVLSFLFSCFSVSISWQEATVSAACARSLLQIGNLDRESELGSDRTCYSVAHTILLVNLISFLLNRSAADSVIIK